mmetsp:Transcript_8922/g.20493  ORF Transcript_8922/g.20493 Transcript_8922/m.20493 type:complete len:734 (+) Transcript_8922:53-2254(+)|eukprot:CAMPEP_0114554498 /NCGR_PEP_ID=MMETSP0114-20121206/8242_1 /TAXON_ID=31324 /ORGANISM="Goniomonas sp, Strain m" /LENGTH=733 /DNA_ID=CAMNT_0001739549 /DNA_START=53 /DNA_END=2254 /DNA_ORIENTATION=-
MDEERVVEEEDPDDAGDYENDDSQGIPGPEDFERIQMIGCGDVGRVFLVRQFETSQLFAMKVLSKGEMLHRNKVQRCLTERDILATVDHPCIVGLHYSFTTPGHLYFVMDYCAGGELFRMLKRQPAGRIPEDWVRFYAAEVLLALEYLHSIGFVYRDLKPENILLHATGHIMLTDFDLAVQAEPTAPEIVKRSQWSKFKHAFSADAAATSDLVFHSQEPVLSRNSFVGTPEYIAPEVISGTGHTSAVDWWTFGVLLFEMAIGRTPFAGPTEDQTFANITNKEHKLPFPETPVVTPQLKKLIKKLLEKNAKKRLGSRHGATEVMKAAFFDGLKWQLVRNQVPPFIPKLRDPLDCTAFSHITPYTADAALDAELPWAEGHGPNPPAQPARHSGHIDPNDRELLSRLISTAFPNPLGGDPTGPDGKRERFQSCPHPAGEPGEPVKGGTSTPRERFPSGGGLVAPGEGKVARKRVGSLQGTSRNVSGAPDPFADFGSYAARSHRGIAIVPPSAPHPSCPPTRTGSAPPSVAAAAAAAAVHAMSQSAHSPMASGTPSSKVGPSVSPPLLDQRSASMSGVEAELMSPREFMSPSVSPRRDRTRRDSKEIKPKRTAVSFVAMAPEQVPPNRDFFLSVIARRDGTAGAVFEGRGDEKGSCGPFLLQRHRQLQLELELPDGFSVKGGAVEKMVWTGSGHASKVDFWVKAPQEEGSFTGRVKLKLNDAESHTLGFSLYVGTEK